MALTPGHLETLVENWSLGVLRFRYADGSETQFRTVAELEGQIAKVAAAIGVANPLLSAGPASNSPVIYGSFRRC